MKIEMEIDADEIKNLDDLADLFFKIAKSIGMPLEKINLTLKKGELNGNNR